MLTRRPLPFLFVMCPECFFLMLFFYGYRACYCSSSFSSSSSFRSSPVYGFSGRPPGGAGCRERSQRSCLRPGGLPSLTRNPGLQRPFRSRRLCRAVACAPGIPAIGRRDVRGNAVSQTALHVVAAGSCPLLCPVPFTCLSPCRRGQRRLRQSRVKCTSRKTFCPKAGKNFCGLPPDSRFRPWQ